MGDDDRAFPNPYPDYEQRSDLTSEGFEPDFKRRLSENRNALLKKLDESLGTLDSSDNSVYTGTSGVALFYWKLSLVSTDDDDVKKNFADQSLRSIRSALDRRKGKRVTFACGDGGPLALGAVLYHQMGKPEKSAKYVSELYGLSSKVTELDSDDVANLPDEFLYGRVGYLFSLLFVSKHLGPSTLNSDVIHAVVDAILRSGRRLAAAEKSPSPLMFQWHDRHYLGAAHGLAGIIAILLQTASSLPHDAALKRKIDRDVLPTLDFLIERRFPSSGNFPSSTESDKNDKLVHWCHGAPGVIHALLAAYRLYGEERFLKLSLECGDVIWRRGILRKGYGLCHGVAGNAYAFVSLYNATKEKKHAYRASKFAEWIFDYGKHGCRSADRPYSLFEGLAGTLYFLLDMENVETARFPAFDLS